MKKHPPGRPRQVRIYDAVSSIFRGTAPEKRECPIFSVLPKRPLSANKTAVRMRTDDCGATCDHRESGFITECGRLLPPS